MVVTLVGTSLAVFYTPPSKEARFGKFKMPQIKAEISIGNILSMAVSMVALLSMVVTVAVFGTQLRSDVDRHERSISDIHLQLAKQIQTNEQNIKALAEISVDLKYMREALSRLENRESRRAP